MPTFDALTYAQRLQAGGISQADATVHAEALRDAFREQESNLATKADLAELRADFAELRADVRTEVAELRTEIAELRTEVRTEIAELRTEVRTEIAGVRTEIAGVRTDLQGQVSEIKGEVRTIRRLFWVLVVGILLRMALSLPELTKILGF